MREMAEMPVKVTLTGHEQYGAWREGQHDDLVLAVALACWGAKKMYPNPPYEDEAYWRWKGEWPKLEEALERGFARRKT